MKPLSDWKGTTHVSYGLNDKEGKNKLIRRNDSCFSSITYNYQSYSKDDIIIIYIDKNITKYEDNEIIRWIDLINKLGFPCKLEIKDPYEVTIRIENYSSKLILVSALMLVRYLFENGINEIPEQVFYILDNYPDITEWDALLLGHMNVYSYVNTNHTIRTISLQTLITKKDLFRKAKGCDLMGTVNVTNLWSGNYLSLKYKEKNKMKKLLTKKKWDKILKLINDYKE